MKQKKLAKLNPGLPPRLAKKQIKPDRAKVPSITTKPVDAPKPRVTTKVPLQAGPSANAMSPD
jgi:hypothetical protein